MEKFLPNVVRTSAFCLSNAGTRSRIHFFPVAPNAQASQPVLCKLTLFGKGIERKSVMLDGGRLGQPDGVRIEDAFPILRSEIAGIFGIEVELSVTNERVNLLSSQVTVEIQSNHFSVQYFAAPCYATSIDIPETPAISQELVVGPRKRSRSLVAMMDKDTTTSLVVINGTSEAVRPVALKSIGGEVIQLQVGTVSPDSAVEVALDEALFKDLESQELSWGLVKAGAVHFNESSGGGVGYFMLYREAGSKRPFSVCAL